MSEEEKLPDALVDSSPGGGLNNAAVEAAALADDEHEDLGSPLGETRGGDSRQNPRGQITGVGGTRGSGAGTGHIEGQRGTGGGTS